MEKRAQMGFTRRDLLRLMLASAVAEVVDVEKLLWVPKPIITVPGIVGVDWGYGDSWYDYYIGKKVRYVVVDILNGTTIEREATIVRYLGGQHGG